MSHRLIWNHVTELAGKQNWMHHIIRIHHECNGWKKISVPKITNCHHQACWVIMTNGDHKGRIFLSHPHRNIGFFFLHTTKYLILYWKNMKKSSRKSWICWDVTLCCNFSITMMSWINVRRGCRCSFLSFLRPDTGEIELSHMGKNNSHSDLVCENNLSSRARVNNDHACVRSRRPESIKATLWNISLRKPTHFIEVFECLVLSGSSFSLSSLFCTSAFVLLRK